MSWRRQRRPLLHRHPRLHRLPHLHWLPLHHQGSRCRRGTPHIHWLPRLHRHNRDRRRWAGLEVWLYAPTRTKQQFFIPNVYFWETSGLQQILVPLTYFSWAEGWNNAWSSLKLILRLASIWAMSKLFSSKLCLNVFESNTHCCYSMKYWRNWWYIATQNRWSRTPQIQQYLKKLNLVLKT